MAQHEWYQRTAHSAGQRQLRSPPRYESACLASAGAGGQRPTLPLDSAELRSQHQHAQPHNDGRQQQFPPLAWALQGAGGGSSFSIRADGGEHALYTLTRHLNSEAARVLGMAGAQLLLLLTRWQHGAAEQGEHLHRRLLPWRRGPWTAGADPASAAAHAGWRLPWTRRADSTAERSLDYGHRRLAAERARDFAAEGAAAERACDPRRALECFGSALALQPGTLEYISRVSKQWTDLTYEQGAGPAQVVDANAKALDYAAQAVALAPQLPYGYILSCVSKGRLALFSDNRTKVRLAKEAREHAATALALDPSNDLAHHLMGRWNYEMADVHWAVRQLVRVVYGASLPPGSFPEALAEFKAAAQLAPDRLVHRVQIGRTLWRLGRKREALDELEAGLQMEVEDINAKLERAEAEALAMKLRREFDRAVAPLAWPAALGARGDGAAGPS